MNDIPPYNEYSSLNSILMTSLYSENSRDLIINKAKKWDNSDKYKLLIKRIVNKNKYNKDISTDIALLNPDDMFIKNMFFLKNQMNLKRFVSLFNKGEKIEWINDFIIDFYRSLGLTCLDIYYFNKNFYSNIYKNLFWNKSKDIDKYESELNMFNLIDETYTINENPDILIIFNDDLNKSIEKKYISSLKILNNNSKKLEDKKDAFILKNENGEFDNLINIEEEIQYKNQTYILDSVLLNYNKKSIVGFRYNGEKYIYNNFSSINDNSCSVIKFDWKYNEGEFCYNPIKCDLENNLTDINDLCINFKYGDKILIFVKKNTDVSSIPDIPDNEILEIIKKIKGMTVNILTENIKKYESNIISSGKNNKEELEKIYLRLYLINYLSIKKGEEQVKEISEELIPTVS